MDFNFQNSNLNARFKMAHELEFHLPPVGSTNNRYQMGGKAYEAWTIRCPTEGCWYVVEHIPDKATADLILAQHQDPGHPHYSVPPCPAPPRREYLPSGLNMSQKLWNELDEVVDALTSGPLDRSSIYRDMDAVALAGYARGLAFSIVCIEKRYFPTIEDVSRHARDRRRMRLGEIPWAQTPSVMAADARTADIRGLVPTATQPAPRAAQPVPAGPKHPPVKPEHIKAIKAGVGAKVFTAQDMAEAYNLPLATVEAVLAGTIA